MGDISPFPILLKAFKRLTPPKTLCRVINIAGRSSKRAGRGRGRRMRLAPFEIGEAQVEVAGAQPMAIVPISTLAEVGRRPRSQRRSHGLVGCASSQSRHCLSVGRAALAGRAARRGGTCRRSCWSTSTHQRAGPERETSRRQPDRPFEIFADDAAIGELVPSSSKRVGTWPSGLWAMMVRSRSICAAEDSLSMLSARPSSCATARTLHKAV